MRCSASPLAHRRGEVDVEAQLIAGQHVGRRIDVLDVRERALSTSRAVEDFSRSGGRRPRRRKTAR